jgi:hypothetical protein
VITITTASSWHLLIITNSHPTTVMVKRISAKENTRIRHKQTNKHLSDGRCRWSLRHSVYINLSLAFWRRSNIFGPLALLPNVARPRHRWSSIHKGPRPVERGIGFRLRMHNARVRFTKRNTKTWTTWSRRWKSKTPYGCRPWSGCRSTWTLLRRRSSSENLRNDSVTCTRL